MVDAAFVSNIAKNPGTFLKNPHIDRTGKKGYKENSAIALPAERNRNENTIKDP